MKVAYADGGIFSGARLSEEKGLWFSIPVIAPLKDGKSHKISVYRTTDGTDLEELLNSPQTLNCPPG